MARFFRASCTRGGDETDYTYDYRGRVATTTVYPRVGVSLTTTQVYLDNQLLYTEDPYGRRTYFAYRASDGLMIRRVQGTAPGFESEVGGGGSSPAWQNGTSYTSGDVISHNGAGYECTIPHR